MIFRKDGADMRILVVEDEKRLNRILCEAMEDEGYSADGCFDGLEALDYAAGADYDVILLDVMLPKLDGFAVVGRLRAGGSRTPVLFLTARDSIEDRVAGLESGGDYYLVKPFDLQELKAVVRAMTRKYSEKRSSVYAVADLRADAAARTVERGGQHIDLTAKEFAMLEYFLRNPGVVLTREQIENNLWNYDYEGDSNIVDVYVGYLRKKVDAGFPKKLIHTVWGVGWVLREDA
jgi:two-component system copper resistance phosphate regulon response regulator CusR